MSKVLKAFVSRDDFTSPETEVVSPIYELSEISRTYSKFKEVVYPTDYPKYIIHSFGYKVENKLTNEEANLVTKVIVEFVSFRTEFFSFSKGKVINDFYTTFNSMYPTTPVTELNYNDAITYKGTLAPDFMAFKVQDIECNIYLSNSYFERLYTGYNINIVLPFTNFSTTLRDPGLVVNLLDNFNYTEFNDRVELDKANRPVTVTRIINIPYAIPNTTFTRNCYFAFNIYGIAGDLEYILRFELYDYLQEVIGLTVPEIEALFPTILDINEFFLVPRWKSIAIPSQVGLGNINSQISSTYNSAFDITKFVNIYDEPEFNEVNTYNLPIIYNNLLLTILNGRRSSPEDRDFRNVYGDVITVNSSHPDFSRMSTKTQQLMVVLERMISIADSSNMIQLFNKMLNTTDYAFRVTERNGVSYLSIFHNEYMIYMVPKYMYELLDV